MEIRVLEYFLAVAKEQSFLRGAEALGLSQPTLSRQIADMEKELGKTLFTRGKKGVELTEDGLILRKRAEEIMELVKKTKAEVRQKGIITGEINIGCAETDAFREVVTHVIAMQREYPNVRFNFISGDTTDICGKIDAGIYDFGVICGEANPDKYDYITLKGVDFFGVLMRRDDPLASKEFLAPKELWHRPLILSRRALASGEMASILQRKTELLNIVATYNLLFNVSLMVSEGLGYGIGYERLIYTSGDSDLTFVPIRPNRAIAVTFVWKKDGYLSKACELFLSKFRGEN